MLVQVLLLVAIATLFSTTAVTLFEALGFQNETILNVFLLLNI